MKTVLIVEIDHQKPLPVKLDLTDAASQRIYGWLYSQGVEAGVKAKVCAEVGCDAGQGDRDGR
jgi:hypothetical protein